jgi:probable F420-dependent oxidoreductase
MRFSYAESMIEPSFYAPLAMAAEDAGYDAFVIPDSIGYPRHSDARYPFTADGSRQFLEDKPFIEPFVLAAALAGVTQRLRLVTFVVKLPIRHPVLVAKQVSSLAVLSANRFVLGVGTSPWPEDYELAGVPWEGRGRRMDEAIEVIRGLSAGGFFEYHGEVFSFPAFAMSPVPDEPVKVLIGGHGDAALRRAARVGDGWMHGGGDPDQLPALLERIRVLRAEADRGDAPFEVHAISTDAYSVDGVRRLEEQGVTDVIIGFRWPYSVGRDVEPLSTKLDHLRRYAETVIGPVRR